MYRKLTSVGCGIKKNESFQPEEGGEVGLVPWVGQGQHELLLPQGQGLLGLGDVSPELRQGDLHAHTLRHSSQDCGGDQTAPQ